MEFHAYNYHGSLMADGVKGTSARIIFDTASMARVYKDYFSALSAMQFGWSFKANCFYPF